MPRARVRTSERARTHRPPTATAAAPNDARRAASLATAAAAAAAGDRLMGRSLAWRYRDSRRERHYRSSGRRRTRRTHARALTIPQTNKESAKEDEEEEAANARTRSEREFESASCRQNDARAARLPSALEIIHFGGLVEFSHFCRILSHVSLFSGCPRLVSSCNLLAHTFDLQNCILLMHSVLKCAKRILLGERSCYCCMLVVDTR